MAMISGCLTEECGEVALPETLQKSMVLYVGSLAAAEDATFHSEAGITHVVTAAGRLKPDLPEPRPEHLCLDLADHPAANLLAELDKTLQFFDGISSLADVTHGAPDSSSPSALFMAGSSRRPLPAVLVHCASGVSRSVSICIAFLMTRCGLSYVDALAAVKTNRNQACPNIGFQRQLQLLEQCAGHVGTAMNHWNKVSGQTVMAEAIAQRDAANALHARLDELEDDIATQRSLASAAGGITELQKRAYIQKLDTLQEQVDTCMGASHDRPAMSILKAAARKAARLIDGI